MSASPLVKQHCWRVCWCKLPLLKRRKASLRWYELQLVQFLVAAGKIIIVIVLPFWTLGGVPLSNLVLVPSGERGCNHRQATQIGAAGDELFVLGISVWRQ